MARKRIFVKGISLGIGIAMKIRESGNKNQDGGNGGGVAALSGIPRPPQCMMFLLDWERCAFSKYGLLNLPISLLRNSMDLSAEFCARRLERLPIGIRMVLADRHKRGLT